MMIDHTVDSSAQCLTEFVGWIVEESTGVQRSCFRRKNEMKCKEGGTLVGQEEEKCGRTAAPTRNSAARGVLLAVTQAAT